MISYSEFRQAVCDKKTTVESFTREALETIESKKGLNAFLVVCTDSAIAQAIESDARFAAGTPRKLEGMIVAIKDNISTRGIRTTCGSKMLENFEPVFDATVIERIKSEGGIIIGKTNMDEFAMGSSNETSYFGPVKHYLNSEYVPGGSSGGSAVAVAAGMAHCSLGSDTGGSIRQPAAFCGNIGLKPTYGRISRNGLIAFASSLDQIGIFSNDIDAASRLLDVISGDDKFDSTTEVLPSTETHNEMNELDITGTTIGLISEDILKNCNPEVLESYKKSIEKLKSLGFNFKNVELSDSAAWIPTYHILATAEASANLSRFDGVRYGFRADVPEDGDIITASRSEGFGAEVKRRIMLGTYVLSAGHYDSYYKKAQQARRLISNDYERIFSEVNFLFFPTTTTPAFKLGEKIDDPIAMYFSDFFTTSANIAGIPAISVPSGFAANGMPIGMQFQAKHFDESRLLKISDMFLK